MKETGRARQAEHGAFIVDGHGTILGFDLAMEQLTGWPAIEIVGRNKHLGLPAGEGAALAAAPLYEGGIPMVDGSKNLELAINCRDGSRVEIAAVADKLSGPGERVRVSTLKILSRSPGRRDAGDLLNLDMLTGLPNGEAFAVQLEADFREAVARAQPLALILADVDRLREVNDRHGRGAGDEVLKKLAGIVRVAAPDETRIFRIEDDDFAILMTDSGRGEARQLAAGLRSKVEGYRFLGPEYGVEPRVTLSLGAASFPADADCGTDLVERSTDALREARSMGRNRVWCYLRRPRVPVQVPVFLDGADTPLVGYTRDLSPSGVFVQTAAPIDIGMRCALAFPLPGMDGKVHVIGRIVRTVPPQISTEHLDMRVPGMGVEFERFCGSNDRRAIELFLHDNESSTLRPEVGPLSF